MTGTFRKLAIVSAMAFATTAQAAPVDWNYQFNLQWVTDSVTFEQSPYSKLYDHGTTVVAPDLISWGYKKGSDLLHTSNANKARSSIYINPVLVAPTTAITSDGSLVPANAFVHKNDPIKGSFDSFSSATLKLNIILDPVDFGYTGSQFAWTQDFKVTFKETPNTTGTALGNADIFAISWDGDFSKTFTYDGYEYTFNYFDVNDKFTPLSLQAQALTGGANVVGFQTLEGQSTAVQFGFNITATAVAVPEPETYAMLLAGLGIIGVVARRRRSYIGD
jgi:hypothetical protein